MKQKIWLLVAVITIAALVFVVACGESEPTASTTAPTTAATTAATTASTTASTAAPTTEATTATTAATPRETIKLTYNNFFPPTNYHSVLAAWWIKEIETRTNGGVKIEYLPGASLSSADKVYDSVLGGMCDIGMSCLSYTMGRFPASEIIDQPVGHPNAYVSTMIANDFYGQFKPVEFDDTHVLYFHSNNLGNVLLAKKPVRTMADMKGLIIRSTGVGAQVAEALGGTGYAAPMNEGYELLSKGVVDGSISGLDALVAWKQAEVVSYITPLGPTTAATDMFVVMNKDKWDSLPEEYKKIFTEVSAEMPEKHGMAWLYYDQTGVDYFLTLSGKEVIKIPDGDLANWEKAAQSLLDKFAADKKPMGLPVDDYITYIKERIAFWAEKTPPAEQAVQWVESELKPLTSK